MEIERKSVIDQNSFIEHYLIANKPLIVTDATTDWDLFWQPEEWKMRFGSELVQVYNDLFDLIDVMPLASFIDKFMGISKSERKPGPQPYVRWYTKMKDVDFVWADKVFANIADKWSLPRFLPDSDYLFPLSNGGHANPAHDSFPARGLFISGEGARTRLHRDPWASDAILCQLLGEKRVVLFDPTQEHLLVRNNSLVDIDRPDLSLFPGFSDATPVAESVLKAGEVLFIPRGWYHHVSCLTDSISLTWNFVHSSTWKWFFQHLVSNKAHDELAVLHYFSGIPIEIPTKQR